MAGGGLGHAAALTATSNVRAPPQLCETACSVSYLVDDGRGRRRGHVKYRTGHIFTSHHALLAFEFSGRDGRFSRSIRRGVCVMTCSPRDHDVAD
jgi:hypothetical protein